ncbi:hypothetical protein [Frigoribacterium sp. MCBA15_019]|uniref:hypothetical protein n=1 Tax=Frigoribacterium sp. MCBA15_019 TaxID=1898745 RepID=UPI0008DCE347|nr:hypothetical protein [Frigoribacterium sp. MCBA15_019]OII21917.1 hypothetical protein BIV04_10005 [Frigoribacterium sp. MCBA15_019]
MSIVDVSTVVVVCLIVAVGVLAAVGVVRRGRRDRAIAARLDGTDPGAGVRAQAESERWLEGPRGEAGGMSRSAGGKNSA